MAFIQIDNSLETIPVMKEQKFISRKEEKDFHGLGIKSIKRVVERYDGEIHFEFDEEHFCVNLTFFQVFVGAKREGNDR